MEDLLAARSQMAMSLAFHFIFAAIGIAMPLLMIIAEWKQQKLKDPYVRNATRARVNNVQTLVALCNFV